VRFFGPEGHADRLLGYPDASMTAPHRQGERE
jgi:hypothetical protein